MQRSHFAVVPGSRDGSSQGPARGAALEHPTRSWRPRRPVAVALGVGAAALFGWLLASHPGAAALRDLPADQRASLAQRTLANLREICHLPDRPRDFCREQASLVLQLPAVCEQACREEARAVLAADLAVR